MNHYLTSYRESTQVKILANKRAINHQTYLLYLHNYLRCFRQLVLQVKVNSVLVMRIPYINLSNKILNAYLLMINTKKTDNLSNINNNIKLLVIHLSRKILYSCNSNIFYSRATYSPNTVRMVITT